MNADEHSKKLDMKCDTIGIRVRYYLTKTILFENSTLNKHSMNPHSLTPSSNYLLKSRIAIVA